MLSRLRRWNDTLPYLVVGILIYAALVELIGVWFFEDKIGYTIGLVVGAAIAIGMAMNLAKVIYDSVTFGERSRARLITRSLLRYFVVAAVLFAFGYFKIGNLYTAIIGMFGLKIAAYLVPHMAKLRYKLTGKEESFIHNDENREENKIKEVTM